MIISCYKKEVDHVLVCCTELCMHLGSWKSTKISINHWKQELFLDYQMLNQTMDNEMSLLSMTQTLKPIFRMFLPLKHLRQNALLCVWDDSSQGQDEQDRCSRLQHRNKISVSAVAILTLNVHVHTQFIYLFTILLIKFLL